VRFALLLGATKQGSKARKNYSFLIEKILRAPLKENERKFLRILARGENRATGAAGWDMPRAPHQSEARCRIDSASGSLPLFRNSDKISSILVL